MKDALLLSGIECYLSFNSTDEEVTKRKESVRGAILREGGIVRSFIDEDVNVIVSIDGSFDSVHPHCDTTIPVVSEDWLTFSIQSRLLLPFTAFSLDPFFLFSRCFILVVSGDSAKLDTMVRVITHFGGTTLFSPSDQMTHVLLCDDIPSSTSLLGVMSSGVEVISESILLHSIHSHSHLCVRRRDSSTPLSLAPHFVSPSYSCGVDMTRWTVYLLADPYEAELIQRIIRSGGGSVLLLRHNLESQLLFSLQQNRDRRCMLLATTETPFLRRIRSLCPSLPCHTPRWLYDQLEGVSNALQTIYCVPRRPLGLRELRCVVRCGERSEGVARVVEQTGALVLAEGSPFMTHWVSDRWFDVEPRVPILHYQWFVDCLLRGCVVEMEKYVCVPWLVCSSHVCFRGNTPHFALFAKHVDVRCP